MKNENKDQRAEFCRLAYRDGKKAANEMRSLADGLDGCKTSEDITIALSRIFFVSERTIKRYLFGK